MNTEKLTEYIKNYLENDRTRSAILLTGAWGCGKSYYIQNTLVPELNKNEENRCIVVSLYGVKTLEALSKSIYLEIRAKALSKKSEGLNAAKIIGKTVVKGIASFFGVNINVSGDELNELYQSIDLTGKLIVLEDLERSGIDILEVMGYVNNLVEQDGVKVLLVANENEIIKYEDTVGEDESDKKKAIKVLTKRSEEYVRIKEKTVSDTVPFFADFNSAIENILKLFDKKYFYDALEEKTIAGTSVIVDEIISLMYEIKCYNLRALLYACQKTMEMFSMIKGDCKIPYFRFVLCANTAFALRLSLNSNLVWDDNIKSPTELGSYHFPLYKCCYDYIKIQDFDCDQFKRDEIAYIQQKSFEVKQKDLQGALNILYNFYEETEKAVSAAVSKIYEYLQAPESCFPLNQYSRLANYLIAARKCIDDESIIDGCKKVILEKFHNTVLSNDIIHDLTYHDGIELWTNEQRDEYANFKQELLESIQTESAIVLEQISTLEDIKKLVESIRANIEGYIGKRKFAGQLDIAGLLKVLPICSAKLISDLRGAFLELYRSVNINDFLGADRDSLILLQEGIKGLITDGRIDDKIQKLQLEWFIDNLNGIIDRLS